MRDDVRQMRSFNRTVTERVGALDDHYLARGRPLGASRLLWEIGEGTDLRTLRARLALDSGYLSRLLRNLERDGLVRWLPWRMTGGCESRAEQRRATPRSPSSTGSATISHAACWPHSTSGSGRSCSTRGDRRAVADGRNGGDRRPPTRRATDARFCVGSYFDELDRRMEAWFRPALSRYGDIAEFAGRLGWCCWRGCVASPSVAVRCGSTRTASPRSSACGSRRLCAVSDSAGACSANSNAHARGHGARIVRLDTNHVLAEAIALYRSAGYEQVPAFNDERHADHWFEKRLD